MRTAIVITISIFASCFLYSCSKNRIDTPYTKLEGNWYIIQTATDDNGNGKMDKEEIRTVTNDEVLQFRKDSTGTDHVIINNTTTDYTFKWAFISNFSQLRRIYFGEDTLVSQIITLTTQDMTLQNYTDPKPSWYILRKR